MHCDVLKIQDGVALEEMFIFRVFLFMTKYLSCIGDLVAANQSRGRREIRYSREDFLDKVMIILTSQGIEKHLPHSVNGGYKYVPRKRQVTTLPYSAHCLE